jgi:hypothetical protein
MYEALERLGFSSNKSYDLSFPDIPKHLYKHFIRGNFDGDGCISVSNNRLHVSFCTASSKFKDDIISQINSIGVCIHDYPYIDDYGVTIHRPTINKNSDKIQLLDYMYKDCSIYLDRKYKKYLKAKQKYDSQNGLAA